MVQLNFVASFGVSLVETAIRAIRFSFHRLLPYPYYNPAESCFSSKVQTEDIGFQGIAIEAPIVKDPNSILPTFVVSLVVSLVLALVNTITYVGAPLGVVQGAPATDSPGGLSSSAQRGNTPNAAPSLWDRAFLALGSVGRGAQGLLAWHDSTASPSIQNRLGIRDRIYEFEYLVEESTEKMPIPLSGIEDPSPQRFAVAGEARD